MCQLAISQVAIAFLEPGSLPIDAESSSFSQSLLQASLNSDPSLSPAKDEPYTLALHSVKVRRTGTTVEAKSLYELGIDENVCVGIKLA